ncbi:fibronectin type III domain-containing protein [Bacterioplanoides sp. SCSIO 12839]|uniref:fibronectin type III domain-containing protein n=1 Tax=Bacterioplanoides sp. SCSIO 12839 TaxID=2829569 RepID=UPI002105F83E|nr:fibronectin type III domain-containing protein [Bacterioplanoides sp. SCSIO 12839]UTW47055.1 metallophosphoesterase family protein [Bacterioplanoides sp. SCSIO 12839]
MTCRDTLSSSLLAVMLLSVSLLPLSAQAATTFHRVAWDYDPATRATIGFSPAGKSQSPYVRYGFTTDEQQWRQQAVDTTHHFDDELINHFVFLTDLIADSAVYYRVCDQDGCGDRFWFKTAPADNSPFIAIAGGDTRNGILFEGHSVNFRNVGNTVLSQIRPLFVMHGGDYTNSNSSSQMERFLQDWQFSYSNDVIDNIAYKRIYPIVPTHGNHENGGGDRNSNTVCQVFGIDPDGDGLCSDKDSYYATDISPLLRVYTLNTELVDHADRMAAQNHWLQQDLQKKGNTAQWRFAQYHRPMFPHTGLKSNSPALYAYWATMFYDHAMNLVVESDTHLTKITRPLIPANDDYAADVSGTVFTGEGSWGVPTRSADHPFPWTLDLDSFQQFKVITVRESGLELRTARFGSSGDPDDLNTGITPLTLKQREQDATALPSGVDWWSSEGLTNIKENGVDNRVYRVAQNQRQLSVIGSSKDNRKRLDLEAVADVFVAADSSLFSHNNNQNFNRHTDGLSVCLECAKGQTTSLIRWDLSSLPECATIESASIRLMIYRGNRGEFIVLENHNDWDELQITRAELMRYANQGKTLATFTPERDLPDGIQTAFDIPLNAEGLARVRHWHRSESAKPGDGKDKNNNNGIMIQQLSGFGDLAFDSRESGKAPQLILLYRDDQCDSL